MMIDLNFLGLNQKFPPEGEIDRLNKYLLFKNLFNNNQNIILDDVLKVLYPMEDNKIRRVFVNLYKTISDLWSDMLFSVKPKVSSSNSKQSKYIEKIIKKNKLWKVCDKVAIDVSRFGNGLFKIRYDAKALGAIIEPISPEIWFPVVSQDNQFEIVQHVLCWSYPVSNLENNFSSTEEELLRVEIHNKGAIENRLYLVKDCKIKEKLDIEDYFPDVKEFVDTGIDDFLVVSVENLTSTDSLYGISDYTDIQSIVSEINVILSKYGYDLEHQGNILTVPLELQEQIKNGELRLINEAVPTSKPDIFKKITWDVQSDAINAYLDKLMFFFNLTSNFSPVFYGELKQGLTQSGSALKRLVQRTLCKANKLSENFKESLEKVFEVTSKLEVAQNVQGATILDSFSIVFKESTFEDKKEETETIALQIDSGLISQKEAIKRLRDLNDQMAESELNQINTERSTDNKDINL